MKSLENSNQSSPNYRCDALDGCQPVEECLDNKLFCLLRDIIGVLAKPRLSQETCIKLEVSRESIGSLTSSLRSLGPARCRALCCRTKGEIDDVKSSTNVVGLMRGERESMVRYSRTKGMRLFTRNNSDHKNVHTTKCSKYIGLHEPCPFNLSLHNLLPSELSGRHVPSL